MVSEVMLKKLKKTLEYLFLAMIVSRKYLNVFSG